MTKTEAATYLYDASLERNGGKDIKTIRPDVINGWTRATARRSGPCARLNHGRNHRSVSSKGTTSRESHPGTIWSLH
jgi:hypothetical protein